MYNLHILELVTTKRENHFNYILNVDRKMQPFNNKLILYIYICVNAAIFNVRQAILTNTVTYMSRQLHSKNIHCSCNTFLLNTPTPRRILPSMWQKFEVKKWRSTRFHPPSTPSFDLTTPHSTFCTCSQSSRAVCFPKKKLRLRIIFHHDKSGT